MAEAAQASGSDLLAHKLSVLTSELRYAWDRSDQADLQRWATQTAADFAKVFGRRVTNFLNLLVRLGQTAAFEVRDAFVAHALNNLDRHLQERLEALGTNVSALYDRAVVDVSQLGVALKDKPADVAPKLLTAMVTSLLVSGGPDANGGAPDLDLTLFGIDAHRSIFSHSILMGAALETGFLSLLRLVQLVHEKMPEEHHKGWDKLVAHAEQVVNGAVAGAGFGMAYHLVVDGLVQPGTLHGMPIPMSQEAHNAVTAGGGFIEAQDLAHKRASQSAPMESPASRRTDAEEEAIHRTYARRRTEVGPLVAALLPSDCLPVIERHGAWLAALADGNLRPLTQAQDRLLTVANWNAEPTTLHEHSWYAYCLVRIALMQTFRPSWGNSARDWLARATAASRKAQAPSQETPRK